MLEPEMKGKIDKLWNLFWSGGLSNPLTAIEQMSYLIFMKRLEDLDTLNRMRSEARKEKHKSIFAGHDDCKWQRGFLSSFAQTIAAGSSEIQKNIISERVLGMPRA